VMFRKPKHFCIYSDVTILLFGSVELTRSVGGIRGVGRVSVWSSSDVRGAGVPVVKTSSSGPLTEVLSSSMMSNIRCSSMIFVGLEGELG